MVLLHLKQIGKVKKLSKWVSHELTKNQKNCCFEVLSSLILCNNKPFLDRIVMCDEKNGFYMTTCNNKLVVLTKKKLQSISQSQTCTKKKVMVTVWWSAAGLIHYRFLNPRETITFEKYAQQIDEKYQKLQCLQWAWVNRKCLILLHNTQLLIAQLLQKLN